MTTETKPMKKYGFASMSAEDRRRIARLGGLASQRSGKAYKWTSEEAQIAGRKGGSVHHPNKGKRGIRRFKEEL